MDDALHNLSMFEVIKLNFIGSRDIIFGKIIPQTINTVGYIVTICTSADHCFLYNIIRPII